MTFNDAQDTARQLAISLCHNQWYNCVGIHWQGSLEDGHGELVVYTKRINPTIRAVIPEKVNGIETHVTISSGNNGQEDEVIGKVVEAEDRAKS